jgi:hypothetical protein
MVFKPGGKRVHYLPVIHVLNVGSGSRLSKKRHATMAASEDEADAGAASSLDRISLSSDGMIICASRMTRPWPGIRRASLPPATTRLALAALHPHIPFIPSVILRSDEASGCHDGVPQP